MFAAKSALLFAVFSFCSSVVAVPPACLLAAVNTQPDQGDLKAICGKDSVKVQKEIVDLCRDDYLEDALEAFEETCEDAGHKVSLIDIATPSPTASKTGDSTGTISVPTSTATSGSSGDSDDDDDSEGSNGSDGSNGSGGSDDSDDSEDGDDADVPEGAASAQSVNAFTFAAVVALTGLAAAL